MGAGPATQILDRLNINTLDNFDVRAQVLGLVTEHLRPMAFFKARDTVTDGAFRRLAQKVDLELLARFARSDCHGRTGTFDCSGIDWFLERARSLGVEHKPPAPILLGRHLIELGVEPGPEMGKILKTVYELQLDGLVTSLEDGTREATKILQKDRS
jgi:tRNA nucleotidyltransferase (CCA-adding enzyme)